MRFELAMASLLATLATACGSPEGSHARPDLRVAVDEAQITLRDSIGVAVGGNAARNPVEARLLLGGDDVFSVGALDSGTTMMDIRVDTITAEVLSSTAVAGAPAPCPGSIPLTDALAIADAEAGGESIAVVPDDDVACAWEIQVLVGEILWEVKVAGDGAVLEKELSDEYSGSEN